MVAAIMPGAREPERRQRHRQGGDGDGIGQLHLAPLSGPSMRQDVEDHRIEDVSPHRRDRRRRRARRRFLHHAGHRNAAVDRQPADPECPVLRRVFGRDRLSRNHVALPVLTGHLGQRVRPHDDVIWQDHSDRTGQHHVPAAQDGMPKTQRPILIDIDDLSALFLRGGAFRVQVSGPCNLSQVATDRGFREAYQRDDPLGPRAVPPMKGHVAFPLAIDEVAGRLGVSRRQLERIFLRNAGDPPAAHYLGLRLEAARDHLFYTSMPVGKIAEATGFLSAAHFCRAFRARYGDTPTVFRRNFESAQRQRFRPTGPRLVRRAGDPAPVR